MQRGFSTFIVIFSMLVIAKVSLASNPRQNQQDIPIDSRKKIPSAKPKPQETQNDTASKKVKKPVVKLEYPPDGLEVRGYDGIMLEGTVDDPDIERVTLLLNGVPVPIKVENGRFTRKIFLPGVHSTLRMKARNKYGAIGYSDVHKVSYYKKRDTQGSNTIGVVPRIERPTPENIPKDTNVKDKAQ